MIFNKCYFDESLYTVPFDLSQGELKLSDRKILTYVNALGKTGFIIVQMVEQSDEAIIQMHDETSLFAKKAKMIPTTFVIKARKL